MSREFRDALIATKGRGLMPRGGSVRIAGFLGQRTKLTAGGGFRSRNHPETNTRLQNRAIREGTRKGKRMGLFRSRDGGWHARPY